MNQRRRPENGTVDQVVAACDAMSAKAARRGEKVLPEEDFSSIPTVI
jgi:hypothetical protein